MDTRVEEILVNKVSSDWKRFARCCEFKNYVSLNAVIEHINEDENTKDEKLKMKCFLTKLYENYPTSYKTHVKNSLAHMGRNDVLQALSSLDVSELCVKLKNFYHTTYKTMNELLPTSQSRVDVFNKFVDLCIIDGVEVETDVLYFTKSEQFLKKQLNLKPIPFNEVFSKETFKLLISGNAGTGKTWLLRKCLLDWSNGLIWKNIELVFYLECRMLNQCKHISNVNELLNVFYKDIINSLDINNCSIMFVVDGLDEFKYLDNLMNPGTECEPPIIYALLDIQKKKSVIAGRPSVISKYKEVIGECNALSIQVMGFNEVGINDYIENNVIAESIETVKTVLKESPIAKSMASVPFFLSCMCKTLVETNQRDYMFLTMTDLLANVFFYFLQKHINKCNQPVHKMVENDKNKEYILNICKIAYSLFIENKVVFTRKEIEVCIRDFDKVEDKLLGFIEKIDTNLGCYYQFVHLAIMEFCASIYAYNNLSLEEIMKNRLLSKTCFPMIFGLSNENERSIVKFLANLNPKKKQMKKADMFVNGVWTYELFNICFYESQASFEDLKESLFGMFIMTFSIRIYERQTYEVSCEKYFIRHLLNSGIKLSSLTISKNNLTEDEKSTIIECSKNVEDVTIFNAFKIDGWKPLKKINSLLIVVTKDNFNTKEVFKDILPWFYVCDELTLHLYDKIDFLEDIYEWIRCSNIKKVLITWNGKGPGKDFHDIEELNSYLRSMNRKCLLCYIVVFSFVLLVEEIVKIF